MNMAQDFKAFLMRGNMVELAIAVVIGTAFGAVVIALVSDFITPLIAAISGSADFSTLDFKVNGSTFRYGHFSNAVISFATVAAAVFFFVIVPLNKLAARSRKEAPADPTTKRCVECLSVIPLEARRCRCCTNVQV